MFRTLLFALLLLGCPSLSGQDQQLVDSLENALEALPEGDTLRVLTLVELWRATSNNDLTQAAAYARQMIEESKAIGYPKGEATGYQRLGIVQDFLGLKDSVFHNYGKALKIYNELGWPRLQGIMLFNTAILHQEFGAYDSAQYYLAEADGRFEQGGENFVERSAVNKLTASIHREQGRFADALSAALVSRELAGLGQDSSRMADADQEIAFAYYELNDYDTAVEYFLASLEYFRRTNDNYYAAVTLINLASAYQLKGQPEAGLAYGEEALQMVLDGKFVDLESDVRRTTGNIYRETGDLSAANRELSLAEALSRELGHNRVLSELLAYRSDVLLQQGKITAAERLARESVQLSTEQGQIEFLIFAHGVLARAAARRGDYAAAYGHQQIVQENRDSIYQAEIAEKIAELTSLYEKEKQDRIIQEQESQLELLETRSQVDRLQKTALGAGVAALLILLAALWNNFRQRSARQQLEKERLAQRITNQQRQLSTHALQMAQKSQLLDQLREELHQIQGERPGDQHKLDRVLRGLSSESRIDQDWEHFRSYFQGVHGDFERRLRAATEQNLSPREFRLASLIKMQLNNQEIGSILGVTQDSLYKAKYRLRKKLPAASEGELDEYLRVL
ncbi:tetratricopeptide repeat protein [Lewinella sp. W8]|uniref:tetratricopeptide repeat protein n=1 Tax=Lewinella sp. W8 TaxID=2528208 RepID=UPI0010683DA8|nr:tetratricopeptide repeat protein [Lewinella sp. W8]MTB50196.1 tetratricopeptide repeat protein [Lewinella sp. W8]